jgi:hypothetical protein
MVRHAVWWLFRGARRGNLSAMRRHDGLVGLLLVVSAFACSSTTYVESNTDGGADGGADSPAPLPDVTTSDAPPEDAAPRDTGPACPLLDLLEGRGAMESLTSWSVNQAGIESAVGGGISGNGLQLCQLEAGARPQVYLLKDRGILQPLGNYYVQAFMRRAPAALRPSGVGMSLTGYLPAGTQLVGGNSNLFIENAWACFDLTATVAELSPGVRYTSVAPAFGAQFNEPGTTYPQCMLIDDVRVYKVPDDGMVPAACRCK